MDDHKISNSFFFLLTVEVPDGPAQPCEQGSVSRELNASSTSGFLSSLIAADEGYGSEACPWIIRVDQGQRVNITLFDFSIGEDVPGNDIHAKVHSRTYCHKYAVIREKISIRETVVCGGDKREENVYISTQNSVEIQLMRYNSPKKEVYFLLKFEGRSLCYLARLGTRLIAGVYFQRNPWTRMII